MPVRPLTLAARVMHVGRYGKDSEDPRLSDLFVGYPFLIRGYNDGSFTADEEAVFDRLLGSRVGLANLEMRLPLLGALGVLPSPGVPPLEAAIFYDAGAAWRSGDKPTFLGGDRRGVTSYG